MKREDGRPDPDDLLERYGLAMRPQVHRRGRLRIFLGAAPGVGKTYAMLSDGHRLRREGHDVVAGLIETHGRAETAAQIGDLEVIPAKSLTYRGVDLQEMDVEAIFLRSPEIVLIDELAHTNAPGSQRAKRWQDVEAIRDAGIDVVSALNIQHLESLNHVVESVTGIAVRETVPDHVLTDANEVQLVDLPVEGLLGRLETGKIYPPERARQAMGNFFRAGNLTALRELALRQMAAGVDERLEEYMHEQGIEDVWPASERVAVLITTQPAAATLRAGWRLASAMRSELIVLVPVPTGGIAHLPSADRDAIERNMHLAEDLGGRPKFVEDGTSAGKLADVLRADNVNVLVLGHTAARRPRLRGESLVDQLFAAVDNVQILLVEEEIES